MKKTILLSALAIGMATATFAQEKAAAVQVAPAENKNQADFKFETLEYNYGTIKQGDKVNYTFNFVAIDFQADFAVIRTVALSLFSFGRIAVAASAVRSFDRPITAAHCTCGAGSLSKDL